MLKRILIQVTITLACFLAVYAGLFAIARLAYPPEKEIDTKFAYYQQNLYSSENTFAILGRNALMNDRKKVIFLGASNSLLGFRPDEFRPYAPEYDIHNMSLNGEGFLQMYQCAKMILEVTPDAAMKDSVFIVAIWHGAFQKDDFTVRNGMTHTETYQQKWRGLYEMKDGEMEPTLSPREYRIVSELLTPYILLSSAYSKTKGKIYLLSENAKHILKGEKTKPFFGEDKDEERDNAVVDEKVKQDAFDRWHVKYVESGGKPDEEVYAKMMRMLRMITDKGAKVILVDMPLAGWFTAESEFYKKYQEEKKPYLDAALSMPNVYYVNLQDLDNDEYFYDSSHIRPRYTKLLNDALGNKVEHILAMDENGEKE